MAAKQQDKFTNILHERVTMSAANTLTFSEIDVGLNIFDKVGLIIQRIEYVPEDNIFDTEMTADGDKINFGICADSGITTLNVNERAVIDTHSEYYILETAVGFRYVTIPIVHNFSQLPGGGILVSPRPLYLAATSGGFANPVVVDMRMYFTVMKMTPESYFELLESRRFYG